MTAVRIVYAALGAGSTPVWLAHEANLFAAEGLETELQLIRGSRAAAAAVLDGSVQFGNFAAPAVAEANLAGGDLVYLTGGMNWLVQALVTRDAIRRPESLRGRTLGTGEAGDHQENLLRYLLQPHGLVPGRDIATRYVAGQPQAIELMDAGAIDGALFSPPYTFVATRHGHRILIDAADQHIDYQLGGLIARRSYVEAHPETVERAVRAYVRAVHRFKSRPDEAIVLFRKYSLIEDEGVARDCWAATQACLQPAPYPSVKGVQAVLDHLAQRRPEAREASAESMVDLRWVRRLEESGFPGNDVESSDSLGSPARQTEGA